MHSGSVGPCASVSEDVREFRVILRSPSRDDEHAKTLGVKEESSRFAYIPSPGR
jgi:hypothetical protein